MDLTIVLVGPTGEGKSATGNCILGRKAFKSKYNTSAVPVTETCEVRTSVLEDGRTIRVIDTPGFCDKQTDLLIKEAGKCMTLAKNKIHAILFVLSIRSSFSVEEQTVAIQNLKSLFGKDIIRHMIAIFTDGSLIFSLRLNPYGNTGNIIRLCENRCVTFYIKAEDEVKRSEQVQSLLSIVITLISNNAGKPYMSQVFELRLQREATIRLEQLVEAHATIMNANKEEMTHINDMVEARLSDTTTRLEQQLEVVMLKAEERSKKYLKEETSELFHRISKTYEEQMTQRFKAVEQRVLDTTTRLEQQLAEVHAAQIKVNELALRETSELIQQMTESIYEVESREKDVTTRLEQKLVEAEAARLKADERAQEAQKNSDGQIQRLEEGIQRAEKDRSRILDVGIATFQKLKEGFEIAQEVQQKNSEEQMQKLREGFERAQEVQQKNSDEQMQKLREELERAEKERSGRDESTEDLGSSSFHVYDPSTYLLQSAIR